MKRFLVLLGVLLYFPLVSQVYVLNEKHKQISALEQSVSEYHSYDLDLATLTNELIRNVGSEITLVSTEFDVTLELAPVDILSSDFQIKALYASGPQYSSLEASNTYIAYDVNNPNQQYRFYISEEKIKGKFIYNDKAYIIDSANSYDKSANANEVIVYDLSLFDKGKEQSYGCVLIEDHEDTRDKNTKSNNQKSSDACKELEISIAADHEMFSTFTSIDLVVIEIISIMNDVLGDYDNEFDSELQFKIQEILVSCCSDCDPWTDSPNMFSVLSSFRDWGLSDGFEMYHDLGIFWTDRSVSSGVVGASYMNSACGTNRYIALSHFSTDPERLRMATSHEIAHSLGCPHNYSINSDCHPDPGRDPLIMDPVVNPNAIAWSTGTEDCVDTDPGDSSVERINEKLANTDCFDTTCGDAPCASITTLDVLSISDDTAIISWLGTADEHMVKVREDGSTSFLLEEIVSGSSYTLDETVLNPSTLYVVSLMGVCGSDYSAAREAEFITEEENFIVPIELISFKAEQLESLVKIKWESASEINNDYYELQRSRDARDFEKIAKVYSISNNVNDVNTYEFLDENAVSGLNYYRLIQYDLDGRFEQFDDIVINVEPRSRDQVFELVSNSGDHLQIYLNANNDESELNLYSLTGQKLIDFQNLEAEQYIDIDTSLYPSGIYLLHVSNNYESHSMKIMIP